MISYQWPVISVAFAGFLLVAIPGRASDLDEFKVKREPVFAFAQKPTVTREGDQVIISFASKGLCDATVAVQDADGRILRHLACGVLGKNAPAPFQKNSLQQTVVWDSKDDQGKYVDDKDALTVRVSLGLKPRFERHVLWSPHRRFQMRPPSFCAQPEGVYVFDGTMTDFIYLFDHRGRYVRTVYPFPSDKLNELVGVRTRVFEQSGKRLPWKGGYLRSTLLTCGGNTRLRTAMEQLRSSANSAMAVRNGRIVLAYFALNRLATDGTSGGRPLDGPETHLAKSHRLPPYYPRSIALSPGGKTAYVTGFYRVAGIGANSRGFWVRGVGKVDVAGGKRGDKMATFAGVLSPSPKHGGRKAGQFTVPYSVDCDSKGRVYVSDHFTDRVQVFDPSGKYLKSMSVNKPADVCVDPRNGEVWVFSWAVDSPWFRKSKGDGYGRGTKVQPTLTHLGPFGDPKVRATYSFPIKDDTLGGGRHGGTEYRAVVDFWARGGAGPTVWLISGPGSKYRDSSIYKGALQILRKKKDRNVLEVVMDFTQHAKKDMPALRSLYRDQVCVNPKTGDLWVPRASLVFQPETGRVQRVELPQSVKEMAFDMDGHAHLSTGVRVSRFAVSKAYQWREVPFDYGEARDGRLAALTTGGGPFHAGGISVSPKGHVIVSVLQGGVKLPDPKKERERLAVLSGGKPWKPRLYPGRGGKLLVRVWDRYGKVVCPDAVQGIGYTHNVFMDKDNKIYIATGAQRVGYSDVNTGTLVKIRPASKILSTDSVLPLGDLRPDRPVDTRLGAIGKGAWWEGVEWFYSGIGFNGKNRGGPHACHCAQFRITHDYYARTFVPETVHFTVAVLDSAGNLILRIGRYGNIDDGVPLVRDPRIPKPRPLGGDEVALFHPAYLAVHTDRRLFINDPGNDRILSVKLGYHATRTIALNDIADRRRSVGQ